MDRRLEGSIDERLMKDWKFALMGGDGTLESSVDGRLASIFEHFDTMLTQCCLSSVTTLHWPIASHFLCVPM